MNITEMLLRRCIYFNGEDPLYGNDLVMDGEPKRFATVSLELVSTDVLTSIMDRERYRQGFTPFYPVGILKERDCDLEGWYNFYIGLNGFSDTKMDANLQAVVVSDVAEDNGAVYYIDLTKEEQETMFRILDEQLKDVTGMGCLEHLAESEKHMN